MKRLVDYLDEHENRQVKRRIQLFLVRVHHMIFYILDVRCIFDMFLMQPPSPNSKNLTLPVFEGDSFHPLILFLNETYTVPCSK